MFRYLVLGLLRDGLPQHGYALMKAYRERMGVQVNTGSFYRELVKLSAEGLLRTTSNPDGADPRRAPYQITELGVRDFDLWLATANNDSGSADATDEVSVKALFLATAEPAAARRIVDLWQEDLWVRSKRFERAREAALLRHQNATAREFPILSLLLARRLKHIAADLQFLEELRCMYEDWLSAQRLEPVRRRIPATANDFGARRRGASR